jgi:hypothetical protein
MPHLHESISSLRYMTRAEHLEAHGIVEKPKRTRQSRHDAKAWAAAKAKILAADLDWESWLARVETQSGRDVHNLDTAWIAFSNGQTASDYALEVVARAGEFL